MMATLLRIGCPAASGPQATTLASARAISGADRFPAQPALAAAHSNGAPCPHLIQGEESAMTSIMTPAGLSEPRGAVREHEGRVAIVTGSTSGIGLGIAEALAARGAAVVLNGFGPTAEIAATCRRLAEVHDVPVRHDEADMAHPAEIAALVERTARAFGPC